LVNNTLFILTSEIRFMQVLCRCIAFRRISHFVQEFRKLCILFFIAALLLELESTQ
jgi:hypothetical protein